MAARQDKMKTREREKKNYSSTNDDPLSSGGRGAGGGWQMRDPPDWKGQFPGFMTPEERAAHEAARPNATPKPKQGPSKQELIQSKSNPYARPTKIDLKKTFKTSAPVGKGGGLRAMNPPDWKGKFPGFMSSEEREALEANRSKPKPKSEKSATITKSNQKLEDNPYARPGEVDLKKLKAPAPVGKGKGLYRMDPPDWKGRFPALERKDKFPLLDLPTELRAEIYGLLLGGKTIHIDWPGCKDAQRFIDGVPYLCSAPISDAEAFKQHGWQPKVPPSKLYFAIRHSKCTGSVAEALPLWVMGLCKQIYKEASLVPFQENVFTFAAPQSIASFLRRLNAVQQCALNHVTVFQTSTWTMWDAPTVTEPLKLPPYLNIKKLTIFIELCPANFSLKDGRTAITTAEVQDRLVSRMSVLWSPKLQKVDVLINNTGVITVEMAQKCEAMGPAQCLSAEAIEAWTGRIKANLLPTGEKVDGEDEEIEDEQSKADRELDELLSDSD